MSITTVMIYIQLYLFASHVRRSKIFPRRLSFLWTRKTAGSSPRNKSNMSNDSNPYNCFVFTNSFHKFKTLKIMIILKDNYWDNLNSARHRLK
jgi:hypothetical protein